MEMFVLGAAIGLMVLVVDVRRAAPDARERCMSDAQAIGYRSALGEDPLTMRTREVSSAPG